MKILHVTETAKGGVGTYLNEVLPLQIARYGSENVLLLAPRQHAFQVSGVRGDCVATFDRPDRSPNSLAALARTLIQEVRRFAPDVIHIHSTFAGAVVRIMLGWLPKRPSLVYCPHGWVFSTTNSPWKQKLMRDAEAVLGRLCDQVVAISRFEAQAARVLGLGGRVRLVTNGIAVRGPRTPSATWDDPRLRVLFVGRLDRQKGLDLLIEAVRPLGAEVSVRVAGEGAHNTGSAFESPEHLEFLGWCSPEQLQRQLQACDVVVMPSRWEGFGLVALEAMRAGKPVIASAVGGLKEVVVEGETGRLVPPGDVAGLRAALLRDSRASLKRMGEAGRARMLRHFSSDRVIDELAVVYALALEARAQSHARRAVVGQRTLAV